MVTLESIWCFIYLEFCALETGVAELELGAQPAMFEKPSNLG